MSDTPITDAAYDAVRAFTNEEQAVDALIELRETSRKLERENAALRELLREARDTVRASTVEDGISGLRREYRCGLYQRIKDTLGKEAQP